MPPSKIKGLQHDTRPSRGFLRDRQSFCCLLFSFFCFLFSSPATAAIFSVDLATGVGKMEGDTTYQIGGRVYDPDDGVKNIRFPTSELKFPLDVYMAWTKGDVTLLDRFQVHGQVKYSIYDDAGKMEDSDWGIYDREDENWWNPNSLDIFSTTDAYLDTIMSDISFRIKLYDNVGKIKYWFGIGYIHQKMDYKVSNLDQWYPSLNDALGEEIEHDLVAGLVGTYHVTYNVPYIELITTAQINQQFKVKARVGYSPSAYAHDEDEHLLRDKNSYGSANGYAMLISLNARYNFWRFFFISMQLELLGIYTDGTQVQYVDREFYATIDTTIESRQMFAGLALGCRF